MRLTRIEAGQFGRIGGQVLDGLSHNLTVVLGPNEAGKSSVTALVRHVLYGYPTPGDRSESPYMPPSGKREARLVFASESGEWVIERTEGVRGGVVAVRALAGAPREALVAEITAGVSRNAYRVVLGFGLSDLAQLEELKGQDGDLLARLYAAGAGINVSPIDVRATLEASKEALWKKGGSAPLLNKARSDRDEVRRRLRELEGEAESLRGRASRLDVAESELEITRTERTATQSAAESIAAAIAAAERLRETAVQAGERAAALGREATQAREQAESAAPDAAAIAAAEGVDLAVRGLSGFCEQLAAMRSADERLRETDARLAAVIADTGWSVEQARAAVADAGIGVEINRFRDSVTKARAVVDAAAARDAARRSDATQGTRPSRSRGWLVPAVVMAVLGLAAVIYGLVVSQVALTVFGALIALAGGVVAFAGGRATPSVAEGPGAAPSEREPAEADLARVLHEWGAWIESRGLGSGGDDPDAVLTRYQAAREVRDIDRMRASLLSDRDRAHAAAADYVSRAAGLCAPLLGEDPAAVDADSAAEVVERAARLVQHARSAAEESGEAARRAAKLESDAAEAERQQTDADGRASSLLTETGLATDTAVARQAEVEARGRAQDARDAFDRLAQEVTALRTEVGGERRDTELAERRLDEESLTERIAAGVREYAVLTMASHLLGAAQARYERDRQPEVVRHAEAAFAGMTNGRYPRLMVPLGKDAIEVFDRTGEAVTPSRLSRGTAEQLYLALRIGLIDQLGDVGASLPVLMDDVLVNFSPERAERAARAIADLAQRRQVVFFTCHPATADLLCAMDPEAARLDLQGPS